MASGIISTSELNSDLFHAFYTDGILRDSTGAYVLDSEGNLIYDGWVTAIGPLEVTESAGVDTFNSYGGINSGIFVAVETDVNDIFTASGTIPISENIFAGVEPAKDIAYFPGYNYSSSSIFNAVETKDTLSFTGTASPNLGTLSVTDELDVFASTEILTSYSGSLDVTEDAVGTFASEGNIYSNTSIMELTETSDVWETSGTVSVTWQGSLISVESSDVFDSYGAVDRIYGSVSLIETSNDALYSSGLITHKEGYFGSVELRDTFYTYGTVVPSAYNGEIDLTELNDTFLINGKVSLVRADPETSTLPKGGIYSIKSLTSYQVNKVEENVFLDRDNIVILQLLSNALPANLQSVKKISLFSSETNLEIISSLSLDVFDWSIGDGKISLYLSDLDITPGLYYFYLILYDDYYVNGLVWDVLSINFIKTLSN